MGFMPPESGPLALDGGIRVGEQGLIFGMAVNDVGSHTSADQAGGADGQAFAPGLAEEIGGPVGSGRREHDRLEKG